MLLYTPTCFDALIELQAMMKSEMGGFSKV